MKFDIEYTFRHLGRSVTVPNVPNPVEADNIDFVLKHLGESGTPSILDLKPRAVTVKVHED